MYKQIGFDRASTIAKHFDAENRTSKSSLVVNILELSNNDFMLQKMEVLPVSDLDVALHNFVNKDDKMAFYSCVQYNLVETRVSMSVCYAVVTIIRDVATFHFLPFLRIVTLNV